MLLDAHVLALMTAPFIGSSLGVLVMRLPAGRSIVFGRSACEHCGGILAIPDLLPLLSWLALHGRCRRCSVPLCGFYPAIECAAVAVALWASFLLTGWILWAGLLVAATIDPDLLLSHLAGAAERGVDRLGRGAGNGPCRTVIRPPSIPRRPRALRALHLHRDLERMALWARAVHLGP